MRWGLLLVAAATIATGPAVAGDGTSASAEVSSSKTSKSRASKSKASSERSAKKRASRSKRSASAKREDRRAAAKRRAKRKRAREDAKRKPNRRTATNMPKGWRWPPNKTMKAAGTRCTAALDQAGIGWKRSPREGKIVTPIVLDSLEIGGIVYHPTFRRPPFPMDCHLALALVTHSPVLYALGVRKVNFGSIFRFTKVRVHGKTKNVLSRHALGLAMDVVSFEDAEGGVLSVETDYPAGNNLLLAVEDTLNSSGGFRTVLTPRNDPTSHHDHFHVEAAISYYDDERNLAGLLPVTEPDPEDDADADADVDSASDGELELEEPGFTRDDVLDAPTTMPR